MIKGKKILLSVLFTVFLICVSAFFSLGAGAEAESVETLTGEITVSDSLKEEYSTGESVDLPSLKSVAGFDAEEYKISVQYVKPDGIRVERTFKKDEEATFRFTKEGDYFVVYEVAGVNGSESYVEKTCVKEGNYIEIGYIPRTISPGAQIEMPEIKAFSGDKTYPCETNVKLPDGKIVKPDDKFTFEMAGTYVFECSAEIGEEVCRKTKIVECIIGFKDLFKGDIIRAEHNTDSPDYIKESCNGVKITANTGATFRFANPVDLNAVGGEKNLFGFIPVVNKKADYKTFSVKLTDVYDSENVLEICFRDADGNSDFMWNFPLSYLSAGVDGVLGGYQSGNSINFKPYGTVVENSFNGGLYEGYEMTNVFAVQFDYAQRKIYTDYKQGFAGRALVMDFNDRNLLAGNIWEGFTTGEVWMDFCFPSLASSASVIITEVCGVKLSGEEITDSVKPIIYPETRSEYLENGFPDALAGEKYAVPAAYATDMISGACEVEAVVLDASGNIIKTENGFFVPVSAGNYKLRYTAKDIYGNTETRVFDIAAKNSLPQRKAEITSAEKYYAGEPFRLPEIRVTGKSGIVEYSFEALFNGKTAVADENNYFTFYETGTLELRLNVSDYFGSETISVKISVEAPDAPVIDVKNVPISAFKGKNLKLPDFTATDYAGGTSCRKSVYVNGLILDDSLTYAVKNTDEVLYVEYIARAGVKETIKEFTVNVLESSEFIDVIIADSHVTAQTRGDTGVAFSAASDFKISMPAPLYFNGLTVDFKLSAEHAGRAELNFTDFETRTKNINLSFFKAGEGRVNVSLNGGELYSMQGSFTNSGTTLDLVFQDGKIYNYGNALMSVTHYADGRVFDGFGGGKVLAELKLCDVTDVSELILYKVANQSFITIGSFRNDAGPVINYNQTMSNTLISINTPVSVSAAESSDVFTGAADVKVKITSPSGKIITNDADAGSPVSFLASEYGKYTIVYSSTDIFGGYTEDLFVYQVTDEIPPEITVLGSVKDTYGLGEEISVPDAFATDTVDGEATLIIYLFDESYNMTKIETGGGTISLNKAGKYKLVYLAYDAEYNMSRVELSFSVTE